MNSYRATACEICNNLNSSKRTENWDYLWIHWKVSSPKNENYCKRYCSRWVFLFNSPKDVKAHAVSLARIFGLSCTLSVTLGLSRALVVSLRSLLFCQVRRLILSGWPGEGRYPKHINWLLGFPRDRFLDPSSSPHTLHHRVPSYRHMASPTIATLMTNSSISLFNQMIQRQLHGSQAAWQTSRHRWKNITYSSIWQRLSFLSSLPLQLYSMTLRFS